MNKLKFNITKDFILEIYILSKIQNIKKKLIFFKVNSNINLNIVDDNPSFIISIILINYKIIELYIYTVNIQYKINTDCKEDLSYDDIINHIDDTIKNEF